MNKAEILKIALAQSAIDCACLPEDFLHGNYVIGEAAENPSARVYIRRPQVCDMVSYGSNVVAAARTDLFPALEKYLSSVDAAHAFETPNLLAFNELVAPFGLKVCFMAEYFLPDPDKLPAVDCGLRIRLLSPREFAHLYLPAWQNALCAERKEYDVLCAAAYDGDTLAGLAGCSADCSEMWQIGVDVLPAYRKRNVAAALTSRLAKEILQAGKVPFYCAAWCNLPSVKNALKCGFYPAWTQMTAMPAEFVENFLNGQDKQC